MGSPFPGMDPYLEDPELWPDVRHELITVIRRQLQPQLLPRYVARIRECVYLAEDDSVGRIVDVELNDARLEILRPRSDDTVTIIEVLRPAHKAETGQGRACYKDMRREVLGTPSNLVEVDLLRAGSRPQLQQNLLPSCDYAVLVSRIEKQWETEVWPIAVSQRLPVIAIPLATGEPDVRLDLQAALTTAYDNAGYDGDVDYRRDPPPPPLTDDQRAWLHDLLAKAGLR